MKALTSLKVSVTVVVLAAGLVLSPACKAQSEIAPDHFDGTDSWEAAARHFDAAQSQQRGAVTQADYRKLGSRAATQLTGTRQAGTPSVHSKSAIRDTRKWWRRIQKKS